MENDITKLLRKRIYLSIIFFLVLVFCVSFILLHRTERSGGGTVSNARLVYEKSQLQAANSLIVQEIHIEEGAHVTQGTLLVTVQNVFSDEELARLQKNAELAQKNVEQIRYGAATPQNMPAQTEELDAARARMERMNELYEMGAVSAVKRDEAIAAYEQEKNALTMVSGQNLSIQDPKIIQAAEEQLKKAEDALVKARDNTGAIGLFAPREGNVSQVFVQEGERIGNGDNILSLDIMENRWIEAEISVEDVKQIYLGQVVRYELNGLSVQGTVEDIIDADTESGDKKTVRISVPPDITAREEKNIVLHFSS
ncbi:HlyD family efflux transporter periplasmic adaptor subunit [uncultured Selenomonas sp.]|uniref:HlyD family secretion protein n=1 Tax=uncultured Selenomonas sp. TaxID=159275 RepID=UPI0028E99DF3|nr:HlyD family efflux transporter periplasmic adaptor subunit [uncultured Selenomonas sp.]